MTKSNITISPKTRVGDLLDAFPELEPVLMAMSPAFEKLKNPVLRKTVAKVATLQQVAIVGGVNIDEMVRQLRLKAGQSDNEYTPDAYEHQTSVIPDWFHPTRITARLNATPIINSGGSPMKEILHLSSLLNQGDILELETPFIPAPIIDMLKAKNFKTYSIVNNDNVLTYICN